MGLARQEYGRELAALLLPQQQVARFFEAAAASIERRMSTVLPEEPSGLGALFGRTEFPDLFELQGAELSLRDPRAFEKAAKKKVSADEALRGRWARYFGEGLVFSVVHPSVVHEMLVRERAEVDPGDADEGGGSFLAIEVSETAIPDLETEIALAVEMTKAFVQAYFPERLASLGWGARQG